MSGLWRTDGGWVLTMNKETAILNAMRAYKWRLLEESKKDKCIVLGLSGTKVNIFSFAPEDAFLFAVNPRNDKSIPPPDVGVPWSEPWCAAWAKAIHEAAIPFFKTRKK